MEAAVIELMKDLSEVVHYENAGVRLYIRTADLALYPGMRAPCHWHEDLECIHILDGEMGYSINGQEIILRTSDSLIVNTRQMHYGYDFMGRDCRFVCILFHPSLLAGSDTLFCREVKPMLDHPALACWHFKSTDGLGREVGELLERVKDLKDASPAGYEMEAAGLLYILWAALRRQTGELPPLPDSPYTELELQKEMVSFIYQNYGRKLTLSEIAASGRVSRNKCCRIFMKYLKQTPVDFLNAYRIKVGCNLLCSTDLRITEIAFSCGFNHLSYFSKMFAQQFGVTPKEYRRMNRRRTGREEKAP